MKIGDTAFGGIIFYLDSTKRHGFVCALNHQAVNIGWFVSGGGYIYPDNTVFISGAVDTAVGAGASNTDAIIRALGQGNYAAMVCRNYNGGGFTDWFLPSKNELELMYLTNPITHVLFQSDLLWSSSEAFEANPVINDPTDEAWCMAPDGTQLIYMKYQWEVARAIRTF